MRSENDRTKLIAELSRLLSDCQLPEDARCAGLTLIGWLARRMPGEAASRDGVEQAEQQYLACCGDARPTRTIETRTFESRTIELRTADLRAHLVRREKVRARRTKKQVAL